LQAKLRHCRVFQAIQL